MEELIKAHSWFVSHGYTVNLVVDMMSIQVWNDTLEDSIDVYLDREEITYRAQLWDEQQSNQTKSC
jgi:hypothetical protein